ncbi:MAG: hypothetical protein ACT4QC_01630 [Planctomycetaceae bacterium]
MIRQMRDWAWFALAVCWCCRLWGMDPDLRRIVSPDTLLLIEINRPVRVIDSRFVRELYDIARDSVGVQQGLASPEFEKIRQAARFVEKSLDTDWKSGVDRLTAGGAVIAIHSGPAANEADVTVVITSDDEAVLRRFLRALHDELKMRAAAAAGLPPEKRDEALQRELVVSDYKGTACFHVGRGRFAVVGRRLLASNRQSRLEAALDRLGGGDAAVLELPDALRMTARDGTAPLVLTTLNLKLLRDNFDAKSKVNLELPSNDIVTTVLLGGHFDLLRRADLAAAAIFADDAGGEICLRLPVGYSGAYPGLRGFFADEPGEAVLPLLTPPGALFSASWYRNYARLWGQRRELLQAGAVRQIEEEDARQKQAGIKLGLEEGLRLIGPHFRVLAARAREYVYKTPLDERLPAFALAVDLRDEQPFRARVLEPIDRLVFLAISAQGGQVTSSEHRGAKVTTIRFAEAETLPEPDQRGIYNINPGYSVTRGHLVVGSTTEIVRDVIDELDRQANAEPVSSTTHRQWLSLEEVSRALVDYSPRLIREAVLRHGLSTPEAERELDVVCRLLARLGVLRMEANYEAQQFNVRLRLGALPATNPAAQPLARPRE